MPKRTTIEAALRRVARRLGGEHERRVKRRQRRYLATLSRRADLAVLASREMWR